MKFKVAKILTIDRKLPLVFTNHTRAWLAKALSTKSKPTFAEVMEQHAKAMEMAKKNRRIFEAKKAEFEKVKAQFVITESRFLKNKKEIQDSKIDTQEVISVKIAKQKAKYDHIKIAEFLTQFQSYDMKIDTIPMLCTMQEISECIPDPKFPGEYSDNVACKLDFNISNKDISDAKVYLGMYYDLVIDRICDEG